MQLDAGNGVVLEGTEDVLISGNMFSGMNGAAVQCNSEKCKRINIVGNFVTDYGRNTDKQPIAFDVPKKDSIQLHNNMIGPAKMKRSEYKK